MVTSISVALRNMVRRFRLFEATTVVLLAVEQRMQVAFCSRAPVGDVSSPM